jgi:hypothetical protein
MKITIETNEMSVMIEEQVGDIKDLLDVYRRLAIALTYHQDSWDIAIFEISDEIKNK